MLFIPSSTALLHAVVSLAGTTALSLQNYQNYLPKSASSGSYPSFTLLSDATSYYTDLVVQDSLGPLAVTSPSTIEAVITTCKASAAMALELRWSCQIASHPLFQTLSPSSHDPCFHPFASRLYFAQQPASFGLIPNGTVYLAFHLALSLDTVSQGPGLPLSKRQT